MKLHLGTPRNFFAVKNCTMINLVKYPRSGFRNPIADDNVLTSGQCCFREPPLLCGFSARNLIHKNRSERANAKPAAIFLGVRKTV